MKEDDNPELLSSVSAMISLGKRKASEVDVIRWVAQNIDNPIACAEDCPAPFAWTLLRQCRGDGGFITWFTEKLWSKLIPNKVDMGDDDGGGADDGAKTLEVLDKLSVIARAAYKVTEEGEK